MTMYDPANAPKVWDGWSQREREALSRADKEVESILIEYGWPQIERIAQLLNHHVQDHFQGHKEDK